MIIAQVKDVGGLATSRLHCKVIGLGWNETLRNRWNICLTFSFSAQGTRGRHLWLLAQFGHLAPQVKQKT